MEIDASGYNNNSPFVQDSSHRNIEFEIHVKNSSPSSVITWTNITNVNLNSFNQQISKRKYLNDKSTFDPGQISAFVFRIDPYNATMCWSRAYEI